MADKQVRLMAAVKEFNVGAGTIVGFLTDKGFKVTNSPMEKLSEEMYAALNNDPEFATDKKAKQNSEKVELNKPKAKDVPKPVVVEQQELFKIEAPKLEVTKIADAPPPAVEVVEAVVKEEVEEKKLAKKTTTKAAKKVEPIVEAPVEITAVEKTILDGPKVITKINLDEVGKPKKGIKKVEITEEKPIEKPVAKKAVVTKIEEPVVPESKKIVQIVPEAPKEVVITNVVERKQLDGLKVMGKITLPVANTGNNNSAANRKRKRIPIGGKDTRPTTGGASTTGDRRGGPPGTNNDRRAGAPGGRRKSN
jgi:translation initiation factor IF-2